MSKLPYKCRVRGCVKMHFSASGACSPEHAELLGRGWTAVQVGTGFLVEAVGMKGYSPRFSGPGGVTRRGGRSNGTGGG